MVKIPELAVSVPTRPIAFGAEFDTSRMSEAQMKNAARLPESDPSALEGPWQSEAMVLAQAPHVIAAQRGLGNFRSFGEGTLDAIGALVSQEVFDLDTDVVALERVLHGGEDHALLATFPAGVRLPGGFRAIGSVVDGDGVTLDGEVLDKRGGWDPYADWDGASG